MLAIFSSLQLLLHRLLQAFGACRRLSDRVMASDLSAWRARPSSGRQFTETLTVPFPVLVLALKFLVILENSIVAPYFRCRRAISPGGLQRPASGLDRRPYARRSQQATRHFLDEIVTLLQVRLEVLLAGIEAGQLGQFFEGGASRVRADVSSR